eukprot:183489_1
MAKTATRVCVVTGANKGIGFEIAKKIAKAPNWHCFLTARDEGRGKAAVESLKAQGLNVTFRQLDITDGESIERFATGLKKEFKQLDALVNNAGFAFKQSDTTSHAEQAEPTMAINYHGTARITEAMLPLLEASDAGTIVNVASQVGKLRIVPEGELKQRLLTCGEKDGLSVDDLNTIAEKYIKDVKGGEDMSVWPSSNYGMSKALVVAYTKVLARDHPSLKINCCCPGYCDTDMTSHRGPRSAEQGAKTPAQLVLLPWNELPTGQFWYNEANVPSAWE